MHLMTLNLHKMIRNDATPNLSNGMIGSFFVLWQQNSEWVKGMRTLRKSR